LREVCQKRRLSDQRSNAHGPPVAATAFKKIAVLPVHGGMLYARKQRLVAVETAVRFVPSEPLEYCAVEVGEPLETQGQLPRRVDRRRRPGRCVAAKISVGWPRGRVAVGVGGRSQNRIGWASKTNGGGWGPVRPASRSPFPLDFSLDPQQVGFDREGGV
jgi:hypothetical protein